MEAPHSNRRRARSGGLTMTSPSDQDVLTLDEAAQYLQCHPVTLKRRAVALGIPHRRLGSLWRFHRPSLRNWMEGENRAA